MPQRAHEGRQRRPSRHGVSSRPSERCTVTLVGGGASTPSSLPFAMTESSENGRKVRLTLAGELDLASSGLLRTHLKEVAQAGITVRLDLSRLDFIDSGGIHVLIDALETARQDGRQLELESALRDPVQRVIDIVGVADLFWPSAQRTYRVRRQPARPVGHQR